MSAKLVSTILQKRIGEAKLLVIALASHCFGDSLSCWPSISRLALLCETSERHVYRLLSKLKVLDYVTVKQRQHQPALFTLFPDKMPDLSTDLGVTPEKSSTDAQVNPALTPRSLSTDAQVNLHNDELVLTVKSNTSAKQVRGDDFKLSEPTPTPKNGSAVDSRHSPARDLIKQLHREKFPSACTWDGSEAKQLSATLKANPTWTADFLEKLIRARFDSEGINGDRPRVWLPNLGRYSQGPLDKYNRPKKLKPTKFPTFAEIEAKKGRVQ